MIHHTVWYSPLGMLYIGYDEDEIVSLSMKCTETDADTSAPVIRSLINQLSEYFSGSRREFDIPINPSGTPFQKLVWQALREIPYGQTRTYGEIAEAIGRPGAARAVGMACNKNPIWLLIPCHRVISSNGKLTGYAGGLDMKRALLELEQQN